MSDAVRHGRTRHQGLTGGGGGVQRGNRDRGERDEANPEGGRASILQSRRNGRIRIRESGVKRRGFAEGITAVAGIQPPVAG
jgi:hypothetical protein